MVGPAGLAKAKRLWTTSQPRSRPRSRQICGGADHGEGAKVSTLRSAQKQSLKSSMPVGNEAKVLVSVPRVAMNRRMAVAVPDERAGGSLEGWPERVNRRRFRSVEHRWWHRSRWRGVNCYIRCKNQNMLA